VRAANAFASLCDLLEQLSDTVGSAELVHFLPTPMPLLPTALPRVSASQMSPSDLLRLSVERFKTNGLVALTDAIPVPQLASLRSTVMTHFTACLDALRAQERAGNGNRFKEIMQRDFLRYDCRLPPELRMLGEGPWSSVVRTLLNGDCVMKMAGVVASLPGAGEQYWHSDGQHESDDSKGVRWCGDGSDGDDDDDDDDATASTATSTTATTKVDDDELSAAAAAPSMICVFVPLVDLTTTNGYTEFWAGSHLYKGLLDKKGEQSLPGGTNGIVSVGDCLVYDFRVVHRGMKNSSEDARPIMYLLYGREGAGEERNWGDKSVFS
jgi:hypothetical protein